MLAFGRAKDECVRTEVEYKRLTNNLYYIWYYHWAMGSHMCAVQLLDITSIYCTYKLVTHTAAHQIVE